ncbi:MAG: hypothetical protein RSE24_05100, partial [Oscillospiraceae bacterium]
IKTEVGNITPPSGTIVVDYGTTQDKINTAVDAAMTVDLDAAIQGLIKAGAALDGTRITNNGWTVGFDGKYSASTSLTVKKSGIDTVAAVTVPMNMTVNVRPNVDELVLNALATELQAQTKAFDDVDQTDKLSEETLKAAILDKFTQVKKVTVNVNHSSEAADSKEFTVSGLLKDYGYSLAVNPVGSGYLAPTAGTAADGNGEDGQYLFTVDVTLTKDKASFTKFVGITPSAPIVAKATNGGSTADSGIYITARQYVGVTDIATVDIVKAVLESSNEPKSHQLTYEQRNDAAVRLAQVQKWADKVILGAKGDIEITENGTSVIYTLKDGMVQRKDGKGEKVDLKGTATAMLTGASIIPFTTTTRAASSNINGDVKENYIINIVKQTKQGRAAIPSGNANSAVTSNIEHSFSHKEMVGITVIGGRVLQRVNGKNIAATGTDVTLTSSNGKKYKGIVDKNGDFAIHNVEPATGGAGFSLYLDDGRKQAKAITNITVVP